MPSNGHDIFVSYAHVDDDPLPGIQTGWVSTFVDGFRKDLARKLGCSKVYSLWLDLRQHQSYVAIRTFRSHLVNR